jgi:dTDP-4-dehydrorhamnose reductase
MKILLAGKNGQVGYQLERSLQGLGEIMAVDRSQMDLANLDQVRDVIRSVKPDLIVNAAAYTAVDQAESEPELAMRINGEAPGVMAEEARKIGAALLHYSTDYVFDGSKTSPYTEDDVPCPISVYGRSKLAGEHAIRAADIPHMIFRTSWVYDMRGKNFLLTILRLAQERDELRIINDQHGSPTWSRTISDITAHIVAQARGAKAPAEWWQEHAGLYHLAGQGQTTWYGFAQAILNCAPGAKLPKVLPITTSEYPTAAKRPGNSVLSCERLQRSLCTIPDWQSAMRLCLCCN